MDFFKSILASPPPEPGPEPDTDTDPSPPAAPAPAAAAGGWGGFGGLFKTLSSQSETVLEAYRRDLAEFGTGLRRETDMLREAAARAARDLPSSAHVSLDGPSDVVAQGKDALSQVAAAAAVAPASSDGGEPELSSVSSHPRYSRFEAQLRALQSDPATFAADPEDAEEFAAWSEGFSMDERQEEIEALCYECDALEAMADRLVPGTVESEVFWARYFYRVHKLKQQEDARAKLVKRVIAQEEDEDLSWEVDDDEEEEQPKVSAKELTARQGPIEEEANHEVEAKENETVVEEVERKVEAVEEASASEKEQKSDDEPQPVVLENSLVVMDEEEKEQKNADASSVVILDEEEKEGPSKSNAEESGDKKGGATQETSDSSKDSDHSIVSTQPTTVEDEDLEWDEIEDLGEHEEKKGSTNGSSSALKEELRKRLSVAEDDEDLSWDIEDDDDKA